MSLMSKEVFVLYIENIGRAIKVILFKKLIIKYLIFRKKTEHKVNGS